MPLDVLAKRVNCETHRTSPSMSLTFFFHMVPDCSSENAFRERLSDTPGQVYFHSVAMNAGVDTHICLVNVSRSAVVSSVLCTRRHISA